MKTVLVTGGAKGIGFEIVRLLSKGEYMIYVIDRDFANFSMQAPNIKCIEFDISRVADISALVQPLEPIDILVNNVGYMNALNISEYTIEDQEKIFKVNLEAPIEFIKAVVINMKANKFGRIINIASVAGQIGHPDVWYGATKAGLINATISLSHILKGTGITINAVSPGPVATQMIKHFSENRKNFLREYVNVTGEYLDPKHIADCVSWFAQEKQSYLNGICLEVNDGVTWFK